MLYSNTVARCCQCGRIGEIGYNSPFTVALDGSIGCRDCYAWGECAYDVERVKSQVIGLGGTRVVTSPEYERLLLTIQGLCPDCRGKRDRWGWCTCHRVTAQRDPTGRLIVRPLP